MHSFAAVRVARPTTDLLRIRDFYEIGVGLGVLWEFVDHDGFDGVVFGLGGPASPEAVQLELVRTPHGTVARPTAEDALVLYVATPRDVDEMSARLRSAGAMEVAADDVELNPYWPKTGSRTFIDPDGYRLIIALG